MVGLSITLLESSIAISKGYAKILYILLSIVNNMRIVSRQYGFSYQLPLALASGLDVRQLWPLGQKSLCDCSIMSMELKNWAKAHN